MASAFTHALVAYTIGKIPPKPKQFFKLIALGIFCAAIPDADVLTFKLGFEYGHVLGHRGFFHSLVFSFILAVVVTRIFYYKTNWWSKASWLLIAYFFICAASHGLLDAMTTGGKGVAFFAPFDNTRYFMPEAWRVIKVSPMSISRFFSEWGWKVIKSEAYWIGIPCLIILSITSMVKFILRK